METPKQARERQMAWAQARKDQMLNKHLGLWDLVDAMEAESSHALKRIAKLEAERDEARGEAESYRDSVVSHLCHPDIFLSMVEKRGPDTDAHKRCVLPWEKDDEQSLG